MTTDGGPAPVRDARCARWARACGRVGAITLAGSSAMHLRLYADGYSQIFPIGPLFLAQGIAALTLAAVAVLRPRPLATGAGALVLAGTLGGFLLSTGIGLFGFHDSFAASYAWPALADELAGALVLGASAALGARAHERWW